jgi:hypothetical protein
VIREGGRAARGRENVELGGRERSSRGLRRSSSLREPPEVRILGSSITGRMAASWRLALLVSAVSGAPCRPDGVVPRETARDVQRRAVEVMAWGLGEPKGLFRAGFADWRRPEGVHRPRPRSAPRSLGGVS